MIRDYVYTIQEASEVLGVNRETVSRWVKSGKVEGEAVGGVVLLPRWAVEMLKREREEKAKLTAVFRA